MLLIGSDGFRDEGSDFYGASQAQSATAFISLYTNLEHTFSHAINCGATMIDNENSMSNFDKGFSLDYKK